MRHFRVALFDVISGTADEVLEIAPAGLVPIFESQTGLVRYEVGVLDDGGILSFSIWEAADEAQGAVDLAADIVRDNLASRGRLRDEHTGDLSWDEPRSAGRTAFSGARLPGGRAPHLPHWRQPRNRTEWNVRSIVVRSVTQSRV